MKRLLPAIGLGLWLASMAAAQNCVPSSTNLMMTFSGLPSGAIGAPYAAILTASGGTPPYFWSAATLNIFGTGLPDGLSISGSGTISGTPAATAVTRNVSLTVDDSANLPLIVSPALHDTCTQLFPFVINSSLYISTISLPAGAVGSPYSQPLTASGVTTPATWSATGLPNSLSINPSNGTISGTPTAMGTIPITVSLTDATNQTATRPFLLTVGPAGSPLVINTFAGNGTEGYSGDGGQATSADLAAPEGMTLDAAGNLYFADVLNHRVRKVTPAGVISTVAGNGTQGSSGDGQQATNAALVPFSVAVDSSGDLYITDIARIRKVTPGGIISTVAGNGQEGSSGDGGPATNASLFAPEGVALDSAGNIYIADTDNHRIRKVTTAGIISTVAGTGIRGFSGDGGPAINASLNFPTRVAVDSSGNIYIADEMNNRVRMVATNGTISTLAGNGTGGYSGDGGLATGAMLNDPYDVAVDSSGNVYIDDSKNNRVRMVTPTGIISTIAGTGVAGFTGDGGPAASAELSAPAGIVVDAAGDTYIGDSANNRIRKVSPGGTGLTITPSTLSFGTYNIGGTAPAAQTISVSAPSSTAPLNFTTSLGSDCAWLTLTPTSGTTPAMISAALNPTGVTAGTHSCVITFNAPGVSPSPTVTATLTAAAGLTLAPSTLSFGTYTIGGAVPAAQTISVSSNPSSTPVNFTTSLGSDCTWLTLSPTSGSTPATLTASINATNIAAAAHSCVITFNATGVSPSATLTATLTAVTATTLSATPGTLAFGTYVLGATAPAAQSISVGSASPASGLAFTTSLGSDCAWLALSPSGGSTPATLSASVNVSGVTAGSHSCVITFNAQGVSPSPTVTATLTSTTLSAAPSTLAFGSYSIGSPVPPAQPISVTSSNPSSGLSFTTTLGSDCAWLTLAPAAGTTPTSLSASVNAAGVTAGSHSCVITFNVPGLSPKPTVTATLTATAGTTLSAAPATLPFGTYILGSPAPAAQTISVTSANPASGLNFTSALGLDCAWLTLTPSSGATPGSISAAVNTAGVTVGNHSCVITFSAPGVSPNPTVTATLSATQTPTLSAAPNTLSFGTYGIGNPAPTSQAISLSSTNPSSGLAFSSSLGSDCAWLNLSPSTGSTPVSVIASVVTANATAGQHSCVITFRAQGVSPSPTVIATLTVGPPLSAAPATLSFGSYTIGAPAPAAQNISLTSTIPSSGLAFTSSLGSDCAWLTLTPTGGSTPATLSASVNTANVTAGAHSCLITFNAAGVSPGPTVTATLTATAPPTLSAAPATVPFGSFTLGNTAPAAQNISVTSANPSSGLAFTSTLGSDCAWLTLTPSTGSTPVILSASVNTANAAVGTHACVITFSSSGAVPGTATATLTVVAPSLPVQIAPTITQVTTIASGAGIMLSLNNPAPSALTATLALSFAPSAAGLPATGYVDPGLQFALGGMSTTLAVSQGSTSAALPATNFIQVGSVSGTITVTVTSLTGTLNGQNVSFALPSPNPSTTITVPKLAPTITSVKIINVTSTGFTVDIVASSTPRDLSSAAVTFTAASGSQLTGTSFPSIALTPAAAWFSSSPGQTAGGGFDLQIPFTYSGPTNALGSASVTLTNSAGTSGAVSGTM